ncbi:MAG: helix-turn-helix transcriptional regulator [Chloroflexi bacterium]|nr:helix-turn-helix transcriptional regulator [Chloroflexota bacterium]
MRKQRRLGQIELSAAAGVARGSVRHAESGDAPVTIDTLLRIADALALDLYLVPRQQENPSAALLEPQLSTEPPA